MYCSIIIDKKNKNKLHEAHEYHLLDEKLTIKCKYYIFLNTLLKYTSLPTVIVNVICDYIDDEITFIFDLFRYVTADKIYLQSVDANINFTNVYVHLEAIVNKQTFKCLTNYTYLLVSENILKCQDSVTTKVKENHTYNILERIMDDCMKSEKTPKYIVSHIGDERVYFEMINYEIMLIICNIIYTILDTYKQCSKQKN